jgi:sugar lactone lactonase YvrE
MTVEIERIAKVRFDLGEGPMWHPGERQLYGIDVPNNTLWRLDPETTELRTWKTPAGVGSYGFREQGGIVMAMERGFYFFDFAEGKPVEIAQPAADENGTRFNDGKVDRRGRFVAGTMDHELKQPLGNLYRLDPDLSWRKLDSDIYCSNGPCWSPDGRTFYFADSLRYAIFAYDYDLDTGAVSNKRVFANIKDVGRGAPDGATVDAEGYVWSALCTGGAVARFAPDGRLDRTIEMPTSLVCACTFGGPDLDVLYVSSIGISVLGSAVDEAAGGVFAVRGLGVKGLAEPFFAA